MSTLIVRGQSGNEYQFNVYSIDQKFKEIGAIYIFNQRGLRGQQYSDTLIYCGKTDNLSERINTHLRENNCIKSHNANCICAKVVTSEQERVRIETDILSGNDFKCNKALN